MAENVLTSVVIDWEHKPNKHITSLKTKYTDRYACSQDVSFRVAGGQLFQTFIGHFTASGPSSRCRNVSLLAPYAYRKARYSYISIKKSRVRQRRVKTVDPRMADEKWSKQIQGYLGPHRERQSSICTECQYTPEALFSGLAFDIWIIMGIR